MGLAPPRAVAATAAVSVLLLVGMGGAEALAAKAPTARSSLKSLVRQTNSLPPAAASPAKRRALKRLAVHARRVARRRPCASVRDLTRFRRVLASVRVKKNQSRKRRRAAQRLSALGPASVTSSRLLLASKRTRRCGGGVKPTRGDHPRTRVVTSNNQRLRVRVELPAVQFVPREEGGKLWTQLVLPNSDAPAEPGTPGIPVVSDVLAVPDGATVQVRTNDADKITVDGVDVFPAQPDPVDQNSEQPNFFRPPFSERPFQLDEKAYQQDGLVPARPADADMLGAARDLNIAALQIPTAQYDADSKKLVLLKSVDVTLNFTGGPHTFSEQLGNPYEEQQRRLAAGLLNENVLRRPDLYFKFLCGEQMLVITNPTTVSAANTFSAARNAAGIKTHVFQTGAAPGQIGTTAAEIQTFIRGRVNSLGCVRPSYVTFIGDDELVPTFTNGPGGIPSDNPYSTKNNTDELPDLAVGRILGNDLAQVDAAIAKILHYETSPPTGPMLDRATLAAQFQDTDDVGEVNDGQEDRTFIQFAETVRTGLVARGVTVDRIYDDNPTTNPAKFNDGTNLPAALQKPTFPWDGDGADVTAAWNEGRFLMIHRDHGWSDGWGDPFFTTTEVDALANDNDNLPIVMSINCASAQYDTDETSFVQNALVKPTGGSAGVFGDTRNSPSWHNSQIGLGFVDALLPSVLPSEGPGTKQRTGDALVHGKLRLAGLAPPSGPGIMGGDGSTRNELYLWHYFGDPTMQMWGGGQAPIVFDPSRFLAVFKREIGPPPPEPPPFFVELTFPGELNGQTFSILRDGEVIGKAIGRDGKANIPATFDEGPPPAGDLQVAFEAENSPPAQIPVQDDEQRTPTTLTQTCGQPPGTTSLPMVVTGHLEGAPEGSTVTVTFEQVSGAAPGQTKVVQATTNPRGDWQASAIPGPNGAGDWKATSNYAGTDQYQPSQAGPCDFKGVG